MRFFEDFDLLILPGILADDGSSWPPPELGDVFPIYGLQRAGFDAVPAPHALVLEYHRRFERPVDLREHFVLAGGNGGADAFFRVAPTGIASVVINHGKRFFGLELHILSL